MNRWVGVELFKQRFFEEHVSSFPEHLAEYSVTSITLHDSVVQLVSQVSCVLSVEQVLAQVAGVSSDTAVGAASFSAGLASSILVVRFRPVGDGVGFAGDRIDILDAQGGLGVGAADEIVEAFDTVGQLTEGEDAVVGRGRSERVFEGVGDFDHLLDDLAVDVFQGFIDLVELWGWVFGDLLVLAASRHRWRPPLRRRQRRALIDVEYVSSRAGCAGGCRSGGWWRRYRSGWPPGWRGQRLFRRVNSVETCWAVLIIKDDPIIEHVFWLFVDKCTGFGWHLLGVNGHIWVEGNLLFIIQFAKNG